MSTGWQNKRVAVICPSIAVALCAGMVLRAQMPASYTKPEPGWLYVVTSEGHAGRILVIDPERGRVVGGLSKGIQPDVLPGADGTRLYVSYDRLHAVGDTFELSGSFEVLDVSTGGVLTRIDEAHARGGRGSAYRSRMALSRDGVWLYRFKRTFSTTTGPSYWVETFDTVQNAMLPETAPLPVCGEGILLPSGQREVLFVVCPESEDVRVLTLSSSGAARDKRPPRMDFGRGAKPGFVLPAFLGAGQTLTVIKTDGSFVRFATDSRAIVRKGAIDQTARQVPMPDDRPELGRPTEPASPTDWLAGHVITGFGAVLSPDGSKVYIQVEGKPPLGRQIAVLNADSLEKMASIRYSRRYPSFTISSDGAHLYAVDQENEQIVVIDTATGREVRVIPDLGPGAAFAVVAR